MIRVCQYIIQYHDGLTTFFRIATPLPCRYYEPDNPLSTATFFSSENGLLFLLFSIPNGGVYYLERSFCLVNLIE